MGTQGAGEVSQCTALVAAQLVAVVGAVGLAVAHPAPRHALPTPAWELVGSAHGFCWGRCHHGVIQREGTPHMDPMCLLPLPCRTTAGVEGASGFSSKEQSVPTDCTGDAGSAGDTCALTCCAISRHCGQVGGCRGGPGHHAAHRALVPSISAVPNAIAELHLADTGAIGAGELSWGTGDAVCGEGDSPRAMSPDAQSRARHGRSPSPGQNASSVPSPQSRVPSQRAAGGKHRASGHWKWPAGQTQPRSSLKSPQSSCPLQRCGYGTQRPAAHWNSPASQLGLQPAGTAVRARRGHSPRDGNTQNCPQTTRGARCPQPVPPGPLACLV